MYGNHLTKDIVGFLQTTPLSIALLKDNLDCAELLHKADVDIDFPDDKGSTVLMNQLLSNYDESNLENVRFLVEKKGANVNIKDMNGSTAVSPVYFFVSFIVFYFDK